MMIARAVDQLLPPRDHPVYLLANRLISLAGLAVLVYHLARHGLHSGRPDTSDALGSLTAVKLAAELLGAARRGKSSTPEEVTAL